MVIPTTEMDRYKSRSGFDKPARQQGALAPPVTPVRLSNSGVFLIDVERLSRTIATHELKRVVVKMVERREAAAGVRFPSQRIQLAVQGGAIAETLYRQP